MSDEVIITRGPAAAAIHNNIVKTVTMLIEELKEHPDMTVNASMYVKDAGFLIMLIEELNNGLKKIEELTRPRNDT